MVSSFGYDVFIYYQNRLKFKNFVWTGFPVHHRCYPCCPVSLFVIADNFALFQLLGQRVIYLYSGYVLLLLLYVNHSAATEKNVWLLP